jgi:glycosyltransferase involved in cell wall biosynthesis
MSAPSIAAIIPVYNRPTVVLEALDSVAAQARRPDRVIVIDDGSTDDTAERVRAWMDRRAGALPCHLVRQANGGAAAARNRGALEADDCELLAFLDSDDLWPADYLERAAGAFDGRRDLIAASADVDIVDHAGTRRHHSLAWAAGSITAAILSHGTTGTPNTVVRAQTYRAVGGQDESIAFAEDRHLFLRLSLRGPWAHMPGKPVTVRVGHARAAGESDHFGYVHADSSRINAQVMERFIEHDGGGASLPAAVYRAALAKWWYQAGRQLRKLRRPGDAHGCFRRSLHWRPLAPKVWWQAAMTMIGR